MVTKIIKIITVISVIKAIIIEEIVENGHGIMEFNWYFIEIHSKSLIWHIESTMK